MAAANGQHDEVAALLTGHLGQFYVDQINWRDGMGWTSLRAAVNYGHVACAQLLLENGAHVDIADNRGDTPLMGALVTNSEPETLVRLLLRHGANATRCNEAGTHALHVALYTGRCVHCVLLFRDAEERHSLHAAAEVQSALKSLLQRQRLQNFTGKLLEHGIVTVQALVDNGTEPLQQILEIDSLTARELVAAARAEAERALTDVREEAKRIATLRERVDNNLWDILVRLHLVDAMIDVILRERFYHLDTLADMLYSDQIRYGVSPQHVRAIQAEVAASQAPKSRHPSPRGATGLDWRPHEDL